MASTINASTAGGGGIISSADSSGVLQLQTAGTTAVTVDASQNVGIGTASPSSKLTVGANPPVAGEIAGVCAATGISLALSDNTNSSLYVSHPSGGAVTFGTDAGGQIAFSTNGRATERMRIDSSGYITNQANGNTAGLVQGYKYYRLDSGLAGANATGAQNIFGVGITLVGSTVYEFEMIIALSKTAGATSHTFALGFGGTATVNNIGYEFVLINNTSFNPINNGGQGFIQTAASSVVTGAIASANQYISAIIKGTVSINAGGTFIPQYQLSAAPGGAYTTQAGSYIKISPISASGANTNIGTWA